MKVGQISNHIVDEAEEILCGKYVDWNMIDATIKPVDENSFIFDTYLFTHSVYGPERKSYLFDLTFNILESVLDEMNEYELEDILQVRVNLMTKHVESRGKCTCPHIDVIDGTETKILIYYVNDSDGPTVICTPEADYQIQPKKGKFVLFDNEKHSASFPTKHDLRIVINYHLVLRKRGSVNPEN
jgi:hypothetical protein